MIKLTCRHPDVDCPKLMCGHPLPCPYHTAIIDLTTNPATAANQLQRKIDMEHMVTLDDAAKELHKPTWFVESATRDEQVIVNHKVYINRSAIDRLKAKGEK